MKTIASKCLRTNCPGRVLFGHGLLPVLRGEGDVHRTAVLAQGADVLAAGPLVPLGVRERVQDPRVLRCGGELQLPGQVEHHRPVPADLPVQQHLPEVAVMGGDLLDLLVLPRETTEALHGLGDRAQPTRLHRLGPGQGEERRGNPALQPPCDLVGRRLFVQALQGHPDLGGHGRSLLHRHLSGTPLVVLQHGAVVPDQGLDDLPLGQPDLLQLLLRLLDLHRDALAEHRR
ncbi:MULTISPECIES: hypothetical protein [unclassified Streptomyces]|uniref:hypothetical protein n=1 Tax=unclassified Streptomyces TaxID=2593676 RepID=UPI001BE7E862|nr:MULTISPECIES: hypothetical protein [unclassified Streptomyces]MBT2407264.1 hypothetical protein [Streptomyces sp. ISL-21]MBT2613439.1 hypothetical protein [Streptomyces sp. ISL-87]